MYRHARIIVSLAGFCVSTGLTPANATSAVQWFQNINGKTVELTKTSKHNEISHFEVLINKTVVYSDDDMLVNVEGVYAGAGHTYLLLEKQTGGNACGSDFQALDLTPARPAISPRFGNCSSHPKVSVVNGTLRVVSQGYEGRFGNHVPTDTVTFGTDHFEEK
jgi:hypothetical protein